MEERTVGNEEDHKYVPDNCPHRAMQSSNKKHFSGAEP